MEILTRNIPTGMIRSMKLELLTNPQIISKEQFKCALESDDPERLGNQRTVKQSWIYKHFKNPATKDTKVAIYVNAIVPINQNLGDYERIASTGNHSVLAIGIRKLPNKNNEIECLELENPGGSEQTRYVPVEHPFFEEVQVEVIKIFCDAGSEIRSNRLNNYGKRLAEMKYGKLENNWHKINYEMFFVQAIHPWHKLEFTACPLQMGCSRRIALLHPPP